MATNQVFRPFEVHHVDPIGDVLQIHAVEATVPDRLLPQWVYLDAVWRRVGGSRVRSWYATWDGGPISLPTVIGDGSQSLAQLVTWLERHGYRDVTPGLGGRPEYQRTAV
jgi:hypothetical protein